MQYLETKDIHQIVDLIYEAAIEPGKWPDLLGALAEFVESSNEDIIEFSEVADSSHQIGSDISDLSKSETVSISDTLKKITSPDNTVNTDSPAVETSVRQTNQLLLNHFTRAIKIAKRLIDVEEQNEVVLNLLNHLPIALFVIDKNMQILETNNQADQIISDNKYLRSINGQIHTTVKNNSEKLHKSINKAIGHSPTGSYGHAISIEDYSEEGNDLMLFITPISCDEILEIPRVALFVSQRKTQPVVLPPQIASLYGLTGKEIEITAFLVQGFSIKEIATSTDVTVHTVRSQVKSIFSKTNTSRQAELVSLVLTGPGPIVSAGREKYGGDDSSPKLIFKGKLLPDQPKFILLSDGRRMAYGEYGDPAGTPLFFCHSMFGSRLELAFNACEEASSRGVRVIVPDRPGYGCSDVNHEGSFIKWAEDLKELANFLEIDRFSIAGYSLGGLFALACAYKLSSRVQRLIMISSGLVAETKTDFEQILPVFRFNLKLARNAPPIYRLFSSIMRKSFFSNPEKFLDQMSNKLDGEDREVFQLPGFRQMLLSNFTESWRQGSAASSRELTNAVNPYWGFDINDVKAPIDLWHGDCDQNIPSCLGIRFAEHLSQTNVYIQQGKGHFIFFTHWPKILDTLLNS